ncbi:MaoC family dehydratase N-terminal domain-containing protein [Nocardioides sp. 1609]|uniref:FAS1-like dehydratase domain-containing protein n=1 Tax=Nocardioides sp. 1609 TaxID=2508327 RepID=UPI0014300CAC|nr:MaoC family dehydratase N-terminal domain-containing protein [Nocardioides sp. 1609]
MTDDDSATSNGWENWTGRTTTSSVVLDPDQANRMAVTLDRSPDFDAGDPLPPGWHWLYFHDLVAASALGPDGHPAPGVTMPPVPLERRMWAAGSLTFDHPPCLGDTLTRFSTIASVVAKRGRTGPLFFVTVEHHLQAKGRSSIREQQTIVYREAELGSSSEAAPQARTDADSSQRWVLDSTALFRYSALTFNGHRIHYDVDYARDVEGYRGLVVHGPLLATLLMDLAQVHGGALAAFSYRARSPLFAPAELATNVRRDSGSSALWATSTDGRLVMDATATYQETS